MVSPNKQTSIKLDELINSIIDDGKVVDGHLILRTRGGAEIDAGVVTQDSIKPIDFMPVGHVYSSTSAVPPATIFGGDWNFLGEAMLNHSNRIIFMWERTG